MADHVAVWHAGAGGIDAERVGLIRANAAIVPAGTGGAISIYVSDPSDVFFDINGYFAP
jgi:hypothetical protein